MAKTLRDKISGFMMSSGIGAVFVGGLVSIINFGLSYGPINKLELVRQIKSNNPQIVINEKRYEKDVENYQGNGIRGLYLIFTGAGLMIAGSLVEEKKKVNKYNNQNQPKGAAN